MLRRSPGLRRPNPFPAVTSCDTRGRNYPEPEHPSDLAWNGVVTLLGGEGTEPQWGRGSGALAHFPLDALGQKLRAAVSPAALAHCTVFP